MRFSTPGLMLLVIATALFFACGGPSSSSSTTETTPAAQPAATGPGVEVYRTNCAACHAQNGNGIEGMYPPLAGSEWVTGDKTKMLGVILNGLNGEVQVKGKTYNLVMTPYRDVLTDQQIADVATFVRSSWGNSASAISASEVAAVRASTAK